MEIVEHQHFRVTHNAEVETEVEDPEDLPGGGAGGIAGAAVRGHRAGADDDRYVGGDAASI